MEFGLLGEVEVRTEGQPVDIGHARQRCVLAVLLVETNRTVSVDQLVDRVWGDRAPRRARETLYSYLSRLRHILSPVPGADLVHQGGGYVLAVDPADVDVHRFHDLIAEARGTDNEDQALTLFEQALGLWRGEPFAGLDTPWVNAQREALARERFAVELDCTDLRLRRGQHGWLLGDITTRAEAHPLDERVAAQLMLALYRNGRQAEALDHFQQLRVRLADELGIDPGPGLRRLYEQILTTDPDLITPVPDKSMPVSAPPAPRRPPIIQPVSDRRLWRPRLVGRSSELVALESAFRRVATGEFGCVLMLADPGVGKSRLGSEFVTRNHKRAVTLAACANPLGETASFGVWAEALEHHLRGCSAEQITELCDGFLDDLAVLLRSVALVRGTAPPGEPPMPRLLEGMTGLLAKLASRHPVVVFLDDMHLADVSSWEALGYLARSLSGTRVLVLLAARMAELACHEVGNQIVLSLEQQGLLQRLNLGPLDPEAIEDLAEAVLGESAPRPLTSWLATRSLGNPLFALSLLQGLIDEGADFTAPDLRSLPRYLSDRIASRCRQLDEAALLTLDLLAAVGERVELADLLRLTGKPLPQLSDVLKDLVRARLVIEEEWGQQLTYEIAHPLLRDVIYQGIGGARHRALHRLIGRSLLASGRLGAAAPHFARSAEIGDAEAIDALLEGVRQAEEYGAYREALTILNSLVALLPPDDARWIEVLNALSWGAEWVVDHRADLHAVLGIKAMRRIDSVLATLPDPAPRASVKFRLANFLAWGTGDLPEAEATCTQALELFEQAGDRGSALLAANELAWIQGLRGDLAAFEARAGQVANAAEAAGERFALLQALTLIGSAAGWQGHFGAAEAAWRRSMAIAVEEDKPYRLVISYYSLAIVLGFTGRIDEVRPLIDQAKALSPDWRDSPLPEWECMVWWLAGDFTYALDSAREAVAWSPGPLSKRRAFGMAFAALSAVEADQSDEAKRYLARGRTAYGDRDWAFYRDFLDYADGVLAWRDGRQDDAMRTLRRAGQRLLQIGVPYGAVFALVELCQVAAECGDPDAAREAAASVRHAADRLDLPHYHAVRAVGACWAHIASGASDRAADLAQQAVTVLSGCRYPYWLARAHEALGHASAERARKVQELEVAAAGFDACGARWRKERVIESLRQLGGAGRRAAAGALGAVSLTRREREVARLAARGHTARQIADRLRIGERTVETHLGNAYAKLGISSKLDLIRRESELGL